MHLWLLALYPNCLLFFSLWLFGWEDGLPLWHNVRQISICHWRILQDKEGGMLQVPSVVLKVCKCDICFLYLADFIPSCVSGRKRKRKTTCQKKQNNPSVRSSLRTMKMSQSQWPTSRRWPPLNLTWHIRSRMKIGLLKAPSKSLLLPEQLNHH